MAIKKSQLYSMLWESCNQLRGGMDASLYKNYVLVLLFVKYMSDRQKSGALKDFQIPKGCTFDDMFRLKRDAHIGEQIDMMLSKWATEFQLTGVLDKASFQDESNLGKGKDLVKTVGKLLNVFHYSGLDFSNNRAEDDDLIGDAYEYLMKNFAAESGKSKGQFYTPAEVSRLLSVLIGIDQEEKDYITIYDPTCGSGSLLLKAAAAYGPYEDEKDPSKNRVCEIFGQEKDIASVNMAKMNMYVHGVSDPELANDDTLNAPYFHEGTTLTQFDYVVANPPFSLKSWRKAAHVNDIYERWGTVRTNRETGKPEIDIVMPPEKCGDYAFLLHILKSMKDGDGRGACILPHGVLFRGNAEADIRKWIVEHKFIEGIIGLPANLFFGTGIPACILLLDKRHTRARQGIFMIDAKEGFLKDGAKNRLREQDIKRILDAWQAKEEIPHYAHLATFEEIKKHKYNLNLSRYITPRDTEIHQDIDAHLHGGIPSADIDRLESLWSICPTLRQQLFAPMAKRDGFFTLRVPAEQVSESIVADSSYQRQADTYNTTIWNWLQTVRPEWLELASGCRPKQLIAQWSQSLQDTAARAHCLVDAYEVYDQLMRYWNETMQDDLFLIADNGWKAKGEAPQVVDKKAEKAKDEDDDSPKAMKVKDKFTYTELITDLLPVTILIDEYFAKEKKEIEEREAAREELLQMQATLMTEFEEDFDESFFDKQKFSKANLKKALAIAEKEKRDYMQAIIPHWKDWLKIDDSAAKIKKEINALIKQLTTAVMEKFAELTEADVKRLVVEKKWIPAIIDLCNSKMQDSLQAAVNDIVATHDRYENTLPELEKALDEDRAKVQKWLEKMGYTL